MGGEKKELPVNQAHTGTLCKATCGSPDVNKD